MNDTMTTVTDIPSCPWPIVCSWQLLHHISGVIDRQTGQTDKAVCVYGLIWLLVLQVQPLHNSPLAATRVSFISKPGTAMATINNALEKSYRNLLSVKVVQVSAITSYLRVIHPSSNYRQAVFIHLLVLMNPQQAQLDLLIVHELWPLLGLWVWHHRKG